MITVIDYGMGNAGSIINILKQINVPVNITNKPSEIMLAKKLILPGVGAFDAGMSRLLEYGLVDALNQKVRIDHTPILGICLGMQLFAQHSEEGSLPGLGWLNAHVKRFRFENLDQQLTGRLRIPHMGWNEIQVVNQHPLLNGLESEARFYFVHAYYVHCQQADIVLATTEYGFPFHSIIGQQNILGTQFHPEKSHRYGKQLLTNFASLSA